MQRSQHYIDNIYSNRPEDLLCTITLRTLNIDIILKIILIVWTLLYYMINCLATSSNNLLNMYMYIKALNYIKFHLFPLQIFHNLLLPYCVMTFSFWWLLLGRGKISLCSSYLHIIELHAFLLFWSPNYVVWQKIWNWTGGWSYYVEFCSEHSEYRYLLYP